ncbi:MAG: ABC transporter permease [Desulfurococcales archaeon]|nr:ABC transporter permease [Desulfurococcales archaeon]
MSVWEIALRSIYISGTATILATTWSVPLAYVIASRGLRLLAVLSEALVGVPTVLVGLVLYMLLSESGPLAPLELLYTREAIIIGEAVLITPLIVASMHKVLEYSIKTYGELALSLGATGRGAMMLALREAAPGVVGSIVMGFSRAIGELGVALMLGGNIKGVTRTMTTAITLDVSMGRYEEALALGAILLLITLTISLAIRLLGGRGAA